MKTLYLRGEDYNWNKFEYKSLTNLKEELSNRNITIGNRASNGNDASIGHRASIGDGASIGNRASIGDGASIGHRASIGDEIKLIIGFYINGSQHTVTYVGNGKISIGCHTKEISWFNENYERLGKRENYSNDQIKEYKIYIDLAKTFYKKLKT